MDMDVEEIAGGITGISLKGRMDSAGAGQVELRFSALAGSRKAIVVDLSGLSYIASLGLRVLVIGAKTMKNKGGKIALAAPAAGVAAVLDSAGISALIPTFTEREAAIAAVSG